MVEYFADLAAVFMYSGTALVVIGCLIGVLCRLLT